MLDSAPAPSVSLQAAGALLLLAVAAFLRGPITRWVQARAEREERSRRTAEYQRARDASDPPDRTADVVARLHEIDRARLRMPATWEADVDARIEAKAAQLRSVLAELGEKVTELAQEQASMRQHWEPVLAALRSLTAAVEERLPCVAPSHHEAPRDEHGQTWRPGDRPRSER